MHCGPLFFEDDIYTTHRFNGAFAHTPLKDLGEKTSRYEHLLSDLPDTRFLVILPRQRHHALHRVISFLVTNIIT